ncbi:MAG: VOC family protein [Candidatus Cybelea sp.]
MQLEPYLFFHGRCEEALNFYKDCLRGEIVGINRFAGSPMESQVDPSFKDKVMHASFVAGDVKFMASDGQPGPEADGEDDIALSLATNDAGEGERVFAALAEGGKVGMPMEEAFWGGKFGSLTDRFGVQWMVSVHA